MRNICLFGVLAVGGCILDLATKAWIFGRLGQPLLQQGAAGPPIWLMGDVFGFETSLNEGALFGMGQGQVILFATLSVTAAIGILYWFFIGGAAHDTCLSLALGSVTAGIAGNLYDRVGLPGLRWGVAFGGHQFGDPVYAVRDWLHFKLDAIHFDWPIFNLADCCLVMGAGLLVWHALRAHRHTPLGSGGHAGQSA